MPRSRALAPAVAALVLSATALVVATRTRWQPIAPTAACIEVAAPAGAEVAPAEVAAPLSDPFAALHGLGMIPVTARVDGRVDETTALTFEVSLDRRAAPCDDEYCHAGCVRVFAVAQDETLQDVAIDVSPTARPDDIIAQTIEPGPSVSAGFCHSFAVGTDPLYPIRVVTRAREGAGRVTVQGWLERVPDTAEEEASQPGPETGEPLPVQAGTAPPPNLVRFMASDPHVPLAEVFLDELRGASEGACARWPGKAHAWVALDTWGQPVGTMRSTGAEGYDVSGCFEMSAKLVRGTAGTGLLASVGYRAPVSAAREPTDAQQRSFDAFVREIDDVWPPTAAPRTPLFFRGADDVLTAVLGGRVLLVAAFVDDAWQLRAIETQLAAEALGPEPYRPIAVFDFDGDGTAEIVFREDEGPWWNDVVLRSAGTIWERVAESVGGGTI